MQISDIQEEGHCVQISDIQEEGDCVQIRNVSNKTSVDMFYSGGIRACKC